jgi:2-amino-4-hydroxy-6-hydroxymethyldihydropteridine diphosphokinase
VSTMTRAFIGVGSNVAPEKNIHESLRRLAQSVRLVAISTFYREPAIGRPHLPAFFNGVVSIDSDFAPIGLKWEVLRPIEAALGRRRSKDKFASRNIDLDLLLCGDHVLSCRELTLPDPDILIRAFIAIPICEIAPDLVLPDTGLAIRKVAEQFATEVMHPLREFTQQLQNEMVGDRRKPIP